MKLAFSTNAYVRFGLPEAIRGIKAAGFDGVEILADAPHAYPEKIDDALIANVRKSLDETGLQISNVNCNCSFGYWKDAPPEPYFEPSLISPNPKFRDDRIRMILKTIDFARQIGAANVSITSGRCLGGMPPDLAAKQFAQSIKPILDHAAAQNIQVGIECEPGLFLEYVAELKEWIDRLGSPYFGANLDIGHSQVIGESIPDVVRMLRGRIWNMHVEDIPGRKHYHLIPGEGTLDWNALRDAVREIGYDRFLTVELYTHTADPQTAAAKSCTFLRKLFS
ncbi:MAG TPA: sugar phosphate isomerase/epimerase family protein [Tepidisphaeraceae bacterium]|jgi:sugar phosphate isomerase/epimerase|nr:sugar phosphate isomerase/epimerase family protein [Tepidisphaeraceae bacterium]